MNTFIGWGFSILLFIAGVGIPTNTTGKINQQISEKAEIAEIAEPNEEGVAEPNEEGVMVDNPEWTNAQAIRESEPEFKAAQNLTQLPPVKSDHAGKRKEVPSDPQKRCPNLEPIFEAYGLYPIETWSYIAWRESGCRRKAQNAKWDANGNMTYALNKDGSYDTGLLQINSSWRSAVKQVCGESAVENYMQGLKTVHCNLMMARYIMNNSKGGLSNWRM